jgi:hypothetical protein
MEPHVNEDYERMMSDYGPAETSWKVEIDYNGRDTQIIFAPTKYEAEQKAIEQFEVAHPDLTIEDAYSERMG